MDDEPSIYIPIEDSWPTADEAESLIGEHGRKKDFTYEQSGTSGEEETGTASKGISKQGD